MKKKLKPVEGSVDGDIRKIEETNLSPACHIDHSSPAESVNSPSAIHFILPLETFARSDLADSTVIGTFKTLCMIIDTSHPADRSVIGT